MEKITEKDVSDLIKTIENQEGFSWPVYDNAGNVTVTGKDSKGIEWVMITSATNFHDSMRKAVIKMFDK